MIIIDLCHKLIMLVHIHGTSKGELKFSLILSEGKQPILYPLDAGN